MKPPLSLPHVASFVLLTGLFACAEDKPAGFSLDPTTTGDGASQTAHVRLHGVPTGDISSALEDAYAKALRDASAGWAESVDTQTGYAQMSPGEQLRLTGPSVGVKHLEMHLSVYAEITNPRFEAVVREHEMLHQQVVSNSGDCFKGIDCPPKADLAQACRSAMSSLPDSKGEAIDAVLTGEAVLTQVTDSRQGLKIEYKYEQMCTAYATTLASCRMGGHPHKECKYAPMKNAVVKKDVVCYLSDGQWSCDDVDAGAQTADEAFFPSPARIISTELNGDG